MEKEKFLNIQGLSTFLSHLYTKLSGQFSPQSHTHSMGTLTGTVSVLQGGTGAESVSTARKNLQATNIVVSDVEPDIQNDGDFWFKEINNK